MKCRKCSQKAVINMRQHKLALCTEHFPEWIVEQTQRFIQKYRMFTHQERVLVAVSGGKDSLSLWDILWQLGYNADGVYIALGIDGGFGYSRKSQVLCKEFATQRGLKLIVVDAPKDIGLTIPELAAITQRGKDKPCAVCGLVKRHILDRVAKEGQYDVLATGHNLDDEAAVLFGNTLSWNIGYLHRQSPVLAARHAGLVRKVKPLCRFYEREMAAYALVRGIEYIYEECPHAEGSTTIYYKTLLNQLETDRPGAKLSFYLAFLQAKEKGLFAHTEEEGFGAGGETLYTCPSCGGPTTVEGLCAYCRMVEKVK
ncbi:MAG: adenine nucleotide alpha hydrolase family protein [Anaerolineales bacterium]|nr:adenine nucleotide alpha hydrolase family protein [Anaerolineales bacterium]